MAGYAKCNTLYPVTASSFPESSHESPIRCIRFATQLEEEIAAAMGAGVKARLGGAAGGIAGGVQGWKSPGEHSRPYSAMIGIVKKRAE